MTADPIAVTMPDGTCEALFYHPAGGAPAPAVLLLTDIMGIREVFEERAGTLADNGYFVLMPNIFYRSHVLPLMDHVPSMGVEADRDLLMGWAGQISPALMSADVAAWVDYLLAQPGVSGKIGAVGYCFPGQVALHAAAERPDAVRAVASYHGAWLATDAPDSPHRLLPKVKAQLYFGHASGDPICPPSMIETLEHALDAAGNDYRSEMYPSGHGFSVKGQPTYSEACTARHWQTLLDLLETSLR